MKQTTAQKISFYFTLYLAIITLFFSIVVNGFFFMSWYRGERRNISAPRVRQLQMSRMRSIIMANMQNTYMQNPPIFLDNSPEVDAYIRDTVFWNNILKDGEQRYVFARENTTDTVRFVNITQQIQRQFHLLQISFIVRFFIVSLGYFLSKYFISHSLQDLKILTKKINQSTIDKLQGKIEINPKLAKNDELVQITQARNKLTINLEKNISSMKQFVSYVSHEFKTPFMVIQSHIEIAEKTQRYDLYLPKIQQTIDECNTMLETLLLITNATQKTQLQKEKVHIKKIIQKSLDYVVVKHGKKDISRDIHESNHIFFCHKMSLQSVMNNIVENSYKYTKESGKIHISLREEGKNIVIVCSDTGVGLDDGDIDNVWIPFWQKSQNRSGKFGYGLGLTLVQTLCEQNNRNCTMSSKINIGTTTTLSIPLE